MSKSGSLLRFLATAEPPQLGPGPRSGVTPEPELIAQLEPCLQATDLPPERRQLVRALILLWHDHFEPAHRLAQDVPGADGAFVHGILHRREPDYANAAYWFRRVGQHPAFPELARRATDLLRPEGDSKLLSQLIGDSGWDPLAFINACQHAETTDARTRARLRQLQQIESETLLDYLSS